MYLRVQQSNHICVIVTHMGGGALWDRMSKNEQFYGTCYKFICLKQILCLRYTFIKLQGTLITKIESAIRKWNLRQQGVVLQVGFHFFNLPRLLNLKIWVC